MEMKYFEMKENPGSLMHFTRSKEKIGSILNNGFLFFHNNTRIQKNIFLDCGLDYFLKIPRERLHFITCPPEDVADLRFILDKTGFTKAIIKPYSD